MSINTLHKGDDNDDDDDDNNKVRSKLFSPTKWKSLRLFWNLCVWILETVSSEKNSRIFYSLFCFNYGGKELKIGMNGGVLWGRPRPGRGCSAIFNRLTPNDPYMGRIAPLTSKRCILYIHSTNIGTEHFKHALYSPFFSLQNAVWFIMLTFLVPVIFTFYIQVVLKIKKIIPAPKE